MVASRRPPGPIARYYAFEVTQAAAFTLPIFAVFFQLRGLGLAEIGLVEATYTVVVLVVETPTGYLGDRLGRRRTLTLSAALSGVGAVAFAFAYSLWAFLGVVCLRAVAGALRSGTGQAWLYETLDARRHLDPDSFAHYRGRASALARVTAAGSVLAGGVLYAVAPVTPWVVEGIVVAVGGVLALTMPEPPRTAGDGPAGRDPAPLAAFRTARDTVLGPALRRFVCYTALVFAVGAAAHVLVQPAAIGMAGLAPAHLGVLYATMVTAGALAADRADWVRDRVGIERWFSLAPPALGAFSLGVLVAPTVVLAVFVGVWVLRAVSGPLVGQYVNDRAGGTARATTLSAVAMVRQVVIAPTKLAAGVAAGLSLPLTIPALGVTLLGGGLAVVALGGPTGRTVPVDPDAPSGG